MDGQKPTLFCGIERLETDTGCAVAVALNVFVDLILNDGSEHRPILHIPVYFGGLCGRDSPPLRILRGRGLPSWPIFLLWLPGALVPKFGRFAAFLSRGVWGGYPPADWRVAVRIGRIMAVLLRIEADLRTHQSALADIYLALPPRWLLPSVI